MRTDIIPSSFRSLAPWRRRDDFSDFQKSMSRFMRDFFEEEQELLPVATLSESSAFVPRLDLQETDEKITLSAELPGMSEKDIEVSMDKDYLTIKGEKKEEKESKNGGRYFSERRFGSFERVIHLPTSADKEKVSAKFDKGVLTVEVPKNPEAKKDVKKIPIKH